MKSKFIFLFLCSVAVISCGQSTGNKQESKKAQASRSFTLASIPSLMSDPMERRDYLIDHFWDTFFAQAEQSDYLTDSVTILGVSKDELSRNFANYNALLLEIPVSKAQESIKKLFTQIESKRDTLVYLQMTEIVSQYLYDPNSPLRSEDLYLPFVEAMYNSSMTSSDRKPGYKFETEMCKLNPYGSKAPDFEFLDTKNKKGHLYGVKAQYMMLFFSNPGCHACKEIIDQLATRPYIDDMIANGTLAILNIYIDDEVDKWLEYVPNYPKNWLNARDHKQLIQSDQLYYVRAIPSLYLLDADKCVLAKDIPVERALSFLDGVYGGGR